MLAKTNIVTKSTKISCHQRTFSQKYSLFSYVYEKFCCFVGKCKEKSTFYNCAKIFAKIQQKCLSFSYIFVGSFREIKMFVSLLGRVEPNSQRTIVLFWHVDKNIVFYMLVNLSYFKRCIHPSGTATKRSITQRLCHKT